jgi:hypothetical protein
MYLGFAQLMGEAKAGFFPTFSFVFALVRGIQAATGWFLSSNSGDRAISRRCNRSFSMLALKRPLAHLDLSLGRGYKRIP